MMGMRVCVLGENWNGGLPDEEKNLDGLPVYL